MWRLHLCHAHIIDVDLRNQPNLFAVITFASSSCHQYRRLHFYVAIYKTKATKFRNTLPHAREKVRNDAKPFVFATNGAIANFCGYLSCKKVLLNVKKWQ
jgi:hypothetical protein